MHLLLLELDVFSSWSLILVLSTIYHTSVNFYFCLYLLQTHDPLRGIKVWATGRRVRATKIKYV